MEQDDVSKEFYDYQLLPDSVIPENLQTSAKTGNSDVRLDAIWHFIGSMKNPDGSLRFPRVSTIARLVLSLPHSNAEGERVFSLVQQNKTCFQLNLDPQETLGSVITVKLGTAIFPKHTFPRKCSCHQRKQLGITISCIASSEYVVQEKPMRGVL